VLYNISEKGLNMSSREINKLACDFCESEYKLMYNLDETSGSPKFCPFCGSDVFEDEDTVLDDDDE
jgi:rRNA maturation endonuclease Nob1